MNGDSKGRRKRYPAAFRERNGEKDMGVIYGTGVYEKGKVLNTPAMAEAYEMGKNV